MIRFFVFVLFLAGPALADDLGDQLNRVEQEIETRQHGIERIRDKTDQATAALGRLQKQMVKTAADIHTLQNNLAMLDQKAKELRQQQWQSDQKMAALNAQMARFVGAAWRLDKRPQALVMMQPGGQIDHLRVATMLSRATPALQEKGAEIAQAMQEAEALANQVEAHRAQTADIRERLRDRQSRLESMVTDRQTILKRGQTWLDQETERLRTLSAQARSLQELIAGLPSLGVAGHSTSHIQTSALPDFDTETLRLPISGLIQAGFGDRNAFGGELKGMEIMGASGMPVIAPFSGIVRYTGDFLSYQGLVIIEHQGGYHSLISGVREIQVAPGQSIVSGEPIGILMGNESGQGVVYFELRQSGRAIDPKRML